MVSIETEKKDYGTEFEEEVKSFLTDVLKLSDVNGGADFHIAADGQRNQIDACGRSGNVLFVFECKASGRKTKKDLRKEILATATKAKIAFQNFRNIPEYRKCSLFKFIFITKKIEVSEVQKALCRDQHMYYEEHDLLEYYSDLEEKIGLYAKYNFLADFDVKPRDESLSVTALRTQMGKYQVYNFYVKPRDLLKFAYVARRRSGKEGFYQRMLDSKRIRKIQKFVDQGGIFPTNIVVSLKNGSKSFDKLCDPVNIGPEIGILTIKDSYSACWIIDGQHRLYSFARSLSNELVSCLAFESIDIEKERGFFLEINREQKPIQPDLLWDLEGLASPNSPKGIISNIVHTINKIEKEPFFFKIYIPLYGSKKDKIVNMAAFCNGIENASLAKEIAPNFLGMANPLAVGDPPKVTKRIADVLAEYFLLLKENAPEEYHEFIFGNAGVPIMLYVLEPIIAFIRRRPTSSELRDYVQHIAAFFANHYSTPGDLRKLRAETNSEGARKNIARQIGLYIRREIRANGFWPEMEQDEFIEEIKGMERRIGNLISSKLSQITTGWEKQRVPHPIYILARDRMEQDGTKFDENFSLGDELSIVQRKDNWEEVFEKLFLQKNAFKNADELKAAFVYLGMIRNPAAHGKTVIHSKEDLDQCDIYLRRLEKVVPEIITEDA